MCHHFKRPEKLPDWMASEFSIQSKQRLLESIDSSFYPLSAIPVIRATDDGAKYEVVSMEWGLLPSWWKPSGKSQSRNAFQRKCFNARSETAHSKPTFRSAFKHRRCLVPVAEFEEKNHYFYLPEKEPFAFAGLWESWHNDDGGKVLTATFLTTEPNEAIQSVGHHRMPVLLTTAEECRLWLSPDHTEPEPLAGLYEPYTGELQFHPTK